MKQKVFYRFIKKGNPTILFLHGWGGDLAVWNYLEKPITQKGYSFLSLDLPGHGLSFRLQRPLSMADFAKYVVSVLNKEKINKVILVGHCFGGMVAQELTLDYPQYVDKLILICTNCRLPRWGKIGDLVIPLLKFIKEGPIYKHREYQQYRGTKDISIPRLWEDIKYVGSDSYYYIYQGLKGWNRQKDLVKIKNPVFIIGGKKDLIIAPRLQKKFFHSFKGANLRFGNFNHIAPASYPNQIKKIILNYV